MSIVNIILTMFIILDFMKDSFDVYLNTNLFTKTATFMSALLKIALVYILLSQDTSRNTTMWYTLWTFMSIFIFMILYTVKVMGERNTEEEKEPLVSSV